MLKRLASKCSDPTLHGLLRLLFRDQGFAGNRADYYDPRNSFLNEVLNRRLGIPISLSANPALPMPTVSFAAAVVGPGTTATVCTTLGTTNVNNGMNQNEEGGDGATTPVTVTVLLASPWFTPSITN